MCHIHLVFFVSTCTMFKNVHIKGIKEHSTKVRDNLALV